MFRVEREIERSVQNPRVTMPEFKFTTNAQANYASEFHKRLVKWINDFDASLDDRYEVGIRLVSFGQVVTFHLKGLGYWDPSLISFSGTTESGDPVELIQHVSQISILLMKMERREPDKPKQPVGFHLDDSSNLNSDSEE
ncbi:DUF6173 family protein [Thermosynechococcaceae cyanobacterium BACA0444]|uniref:DUF6173 family protein n=1 Tax=Pseudocalidococcus azoricus BACA0444 TaxID=2918990 RepID=A0AAE4JXN8_9CYAN|nr:DUF6173 family protein [Pseudocalidococcus azoricus]MDS3862466.1 DUF6173 family protein [Pseudocalidococcus azoricus BACA0444]